MYYQAMRNALNCLIIIFYYNDMARISLRPTPMLQQAVLRKGGHLRDSITRNGPRLHPPYVRATSLAMFTCRNAIPPNLYVIMSTYKTLIIHLYFPTYSFLYKYLFIFY